jgi:hypothetical protein
MLTSLAAAPCAAGDEPCNPLNIFNPVSFPPTGFYPLADWVKQYNRSTLLLGPDNAPIGAPASVTTEQPDLVWEKLVSFPESDQPLTINVQYHPDDPPVPYTIDNPVIVISLNVNKPSTFAGGGFRSVRDAYLPILDLDSNGEAVFRPYEVNTHDKTYNNWMTAHIAEQEDGGVVYAPGTTLHYVREVLGLGGCSDPEDPAPNAMPCVLAPSIAVSGVGMPYMFPGDDGSVPFSDPWEYRPGIGADQPASARWWKQQLYVFVADRDAFVRPSFNPSMRRTTERLPTQNGRPIWSVEKGVGSYRAPTADEPLYDAYITATADFVGYTDNGRNNPPTEYRGTQGFEDWLVKWKSNSWDSAPRDWQDLDYVVGFPFSGLGLTLNWNEFDPEAKDFVPGDLSGSFGAASEMIHATHHPMFLITYIEPHQYLNEPAAGEVPWCDTCPGDFNRDGMVDGSDLAELLLHWDYGGVPSADGQCFNLDRQSPTIDSGDLGQLLSNWGGCAWPLPDFRPADCP